MDNANAILLNRFFTRNTFKQAIGNVDTDTYIATINRYVLDPRGKSNGECIGKIYQYLRNNYQNEYYYKNTILNKLLLGVHSLRTATALTELPVASSKADFVLINGNAVVYEIKTDLDNFERLSGQIEDYYKAFSRVVVVTSEAHYEEIKKRLSDSPVGICVLTKKETLSFRKDPMDFRDGISFDAMFKVLRKNEYESIIIKHFGELPKVSQFNYYRACHELFESLPKEEAYNSFVNALKNRRSIDIKAYSKVPYELKFLVYFSDYKKDDYDRLTRFLELQEE